MSDDDEVIVHYDEFIRDTGKARLYVIGGEEKWIPNSVHDDFEDGTFSVERWFARKEGL